MFLLISDWYLKVLYIFLFTAKTIRATTLNVIISLANNHTLILTEIAKQFDTRFMNDCVKVTF